MDRLCFIRIGRWCRRRKLSEGDEEVIIEENHRLLDSFLLLFLFLPAVVVERLCIVYYSRTLKSSFLIFG